MLILNGAALYVDFDAKMFLLNLPTQSRNSTNQGIIKATIRFEQIVCHLIHMLEGRKSGT